MAKLTSQVMEDIKAAMKARNQVALLTLRALKTALTNAAIEKGGLNTVLEDNEEINVVRKQLKQREDAAEQYANAGRPELAEKELAEMEVLKQFLPVQLTSDELKAIVDQVAEENGFSSKKDMGAMMKALQEKTAGRANGKELAQLVSQKLS